MTKFLAIELKRLIDLLPHTDPCTYNYQQLITNIEILSSGAGETVDELCSLFTNAGSETAEGNVPETAPAEEDAPESTPVEEEKPKPAKSKKAAAPAFKPEQVRAALGEAKLEGITLTPMLNACGASNFSGVNPDDYPKLMKLLEEAKEELKELS